MTNTEKTPSEEQPQEDTSKVKKRKIPKWLQKLEAESWQAELLISGLVVAGLLQAPDLLITWGEYYLIHSTELGEFFIQMAIMMVLFAMEVLIIIFGIHFCLRAIWIAMLGLNSVYPDGINTASKAGSGPLYWKKAKKLYPDLSAYNKELDDWCSTLFSSAVSSVIALFSLSAIILLFYFVINFLVGWFPWLSAYVMKIAAVLYFLFLGVALLTTFLAKKFPENKYVEKIVDGFGKFNRVFFSLYVFEKPMGYTTSILMSNSTNNRSFIVIFVFSFFLGLVGGSRLETHPAFSYMKSDRYITFNNRPHIFFSFNYENLRDKNQYIFTPVIESDVVHESVMKLFIPDISREVEQMDLINLSLREKLKHTRAYRDSISQINLATYKNFNPIFVNGKSYPDLNPQYYYHPNMEEEGLLYYVPTKDFVEGQNILEIKKQYFSKDGKQKIVKIPFYFEKRWQR